MSLLDSIDFSRFPDLTDKLNQNEIERLNHIFTPKPIQENIADLASNQAITEKRKMTYKGIAFITSLFIGLAVGIFSDQGIFHGIQIFFICWIISWIIEYILFFGKDMPQTMKEDILQNICHLVHPELKYDTRGSNAFLPLDTSLVTDGFIKPYERVVPPQDSISYTITDSLQNIPVQGFELCTFRRQKIGINGKIKNSEVEHCYIIKVSFPKARIKIPENSPIKIVRDVSDKTVFVKPNTKKQSANLSGFLPNMKHNGNYSNIIRFIGTLNKGHTYFVLIMFSPIILVIGVIVLVVLFHLFQGAQQGLGPAAQWILLIIGVGTWSLWKPGKKWVQSKRKSRVILENAEFENIFDVECNDQLVSRAIITPAFMDRLIIFTRRTGTVWEFLFRGNQLYIKKEISHKHMEVETREDIRKGLREFAQFYIEMREVHSLIHDLNLSYFSKTPHTNTSLLSDTHSAAVIQQSTVIL